jgi:hypothetical protein
VRNSGCAIAGANNREKRVIALLPDVCRDGRHALPYTPSAAARRARLGPRAPSPRTEGAGPPSPGPQHVRGARHARPHRHQHLPLQAPAVMAKAGRPLALSMPSLERAFMLGNELIAASEEFGNAKGWRDCIQQRFGLSYRAARRYIVFAQWANGHTEDFARLLHMKRQPSFLIAPRIAAMFRSRSKTAELAHRSEAGADCQ